MKTQLLFSAIFFLVATSLFAQADGNYSAASQQGNNAPASSSSVDSYSSINNLSAGSYSVSVTNGSSCAPACNGTAVNFSNAGTAPASYSWSPGYAQTQTFNPVTNKWEYGATNPNAQANASLPYDNTVIFDADVMINVLATSYTAIFSATDFGTTVSSADSTMSARLKIFLDGLKKDSVLDKDIHIDFIMTLPVYEVEQQNKVFSNIAMEKPAGFKIKKNVHILFYDHHKLDKIITDAARAGIYDLVKVDYNVNDIQSAYDTLRAVAAKVIAMKRSTYEQMGFTTTIMTMAEGYDSKYPDELYASYTAYMQGVSAQNVQQQNPNVQVRQAEKEQTIFYNKIPYKMFDKVLNADLAEPGVQFFYKLRVKCKMAVITPDDGKDAKTPNAKTASSAAGSYHPPVHTAMQSGLKP